MLQRYPKTIRWRQLLPPLFVLGILLLLLASLLWTVSAYILFFFILTYLLILSITGFGLALKKGDLPMTLGFPLAVGTMHLTWGSALLWSLVAR